MPRCSKRFSKQVTEVVQDKGGPAEKLQEKVEEIVMEKIAKAVQKKPEEVQKQTDKGTRKRRTSFDERGVTHRSE